MALAFPFAYPFAYTLAVGVAATFSSIDSDPSSLQSLDKPVDSKPDDNADAEDGDDNDDVSQVAVLGSSLPSRPQLFYSVTTGHDTPKVFVQILNLLHHNSQSLQLKLVSKFLESLIPTHLVKLITLFKIIITFATSLLPFNFCLKPTLNLSFFRITEPFLTFLRSIECLVLDRRLTLIFTCSRNITKVHFTHICN